ncbi:MAG TPA: TIR domain-containing protein [Herpetosiphonaceae bacterium]
MQPTIARDLFISHTSRDAEWVRGYLLPALGLPAERIITPQDFVPGTPIVDAFERAVLDSRYTLLVLSQAYLADQWSQLGGKLASFLSVDEQQERLIPLRLGRFELPPQLGFRVALDYTAEANWEGETARLRDLIKSPPPREVFVPCPYPGMVPFGQDDASRFYGRDAEIQKMVDRLHQHRLLFVIGPSGSGKSSLVFAGLLPRLAAGQDFPRDFWRVCSMRPGKQPTKTLVELLAGDVSRHAELVATALARPPAAQRLLLVIDQFEELFTQAERGEQMRFIAALLSLRSYENCVLLITMRADFYPELMSSTLWPVLPSQRLEVAPLRGPALREAIQYPAASVGAYLEPALVERLIADGHDEPGVLPLLQETMRLLWSKRQRRLLTLSAYEQMGHDGGSGLAVAVATRADATLADLTPAQRQIARRVLLCLVQLGENSPDTRRQQPLCELCSPKDEPDDFRYTLDHLTDNRLLIRSGDDQAATNGQESRVLVDLAHEVLITSWPQLKMWLEEDRAGLLLHRRLAQTCDDWIKRRRDVSFLYGGSRLVEAQRYAEEHPNDITEDEDEFLGASAARELVRERSRYLGQAAGGALGTGLGYGAAFALARWSDPGALTQVTVAGLSLIFFVFFAVGQVAGFCIGVGLWLYRERPTLRAAATAIIGACASSSAFVLFSWLTLPPGAITGQVLARLIAQGLMLGAGIGIGVGWKQRQPLATILGGVLGVGLAVALRLLAWNPIVAVIAGILLGTMTSLGFRATAVDNNPHLVV